MRTSILALGLATTLMACGGSTAGSDGPSPGAGTPTAGDNRSPASSVTDAPKGASESTTSAGSCPTPATVLVPSGGVIARPAGSALRLQLVYQGTSIGVKEVRGVDMILAPADGPFAAGEVSGYWVESRSGATTTYQHLFRDPTVQEAPGAPDGSGFTNSTIERCTEKLILADVPNDGSATEILVFGSPYGTQDAAIELARFTIK
jgi:hypothetical protein